ncbi:hypothetical protein K8R03_02020 [Candidatus Kaiserbacteria bacterium]|nr:hypothetical protein [Candidatus Kaiserbacteria bacterium]
MTKDMMPEIVSALIFCVLAVFLLNPMGLWMPSMAHMTMLALSAVAFGAFIVFILRESAKDERDAVHRSAAGRAAFLAGSAVLILGIIVQNSMHRIDPWLVVALIAMVVGKVVARIWSTLYR